MNAGVPQSQIKCGTASLQRSFSTSTASSSSTTVSKRPAKRRLSIDAELASAHREIISLSRASPIERVAAENLRRRSWGEVDVNVDRASLRKEVLDLTGKTEKEGEEAEGSAEKADGILPNSVKLDNQRQEGNVKGKSAVEVSKTTSSVTTSMMESKGSSQHRPDSSLSVKSASRPRAFTSVLRRHSMRKTMKEDSEGEKEVASELTGKRRSSKDAMDKPGKRSASRSSQRSQGHRSSSSINGDGSRNAISKGNRNLHTGSNMQGRDVTRRKSNDEVSLNVIYIFHHSRFIHRSQREREKERCRACRRGARALYSAWNGGVRGGPSVALYECTKAKRVLKARHANDVNEANPIPNTSNSLSLILHAFSFPPPPLVPCPPLHSSRLSLAHSLAQALFACTRTTLIFLPFHPNKSNDNESRQYR